MKSAVTSEVAIVRPTAETKLAVPDTLAKRIQKRRRIVARLYPALYILPVLLIVSSIVLLLVLLPSPVPPFQRKTYVDENALSPAHSHVYWAQDPSDVARADNLSALIHKIAPEDSASRASSIAGILRSYGIQAEIQGYTITLPSSSPEGSQRTEGFNVYARWNSPRTNGRESIVIAAPWISSWDGRSDPWMKPPTPEQAMLSPYERTALRRVNVRGIATILAMSKFLAKSNHWSKDLIFVISDGHLAGMQAWTNSYFNFLQSNIRADPVSSSGSQIWNAIIVDYPSDSFSALEIHHEGLNGAVPNMDVLNTFVKVAESVGNIEMRIPADWEMDETIKAQWKAGGQWGWLGEEIEKLWWKHRGVARYRMGVKNLARQIGYLGTGHPSGLHGLFHRFHVDAFTVFAVPARGPYGFANMGRLIESQLRSYSNLLERLHHSQFFYLLTSPHRFVQIGLALPIALLISAALTIIGLHRISAVQHRSNVAKDAAVARAKQDIEQLAAAAGSQKAAYFCGDDLEHPSDVDRLKSAISYAAVFSENGSPTMFAPVLERLASDLRHEGVPITPVSVLALAALAFGAGFFLLASRIPVDCAANGLSTCKPLTTLSTLPLLAPGSLAMLGTAMLRASPAPPLREASVSQKRSRRYALAQSLYAVCALLTGVALAVTALLNFSLAILLAVTVGIAVALNPPSQSQESGIQETEKTKSSLFRYLSPFLVLLLLPQLLLQVCKHILSPTLIIPRYLPSVGGRVVSNPVHDFVASHLLRTRPPTSSTMYAIREAADIRALHGWGAERALTTLLWDYHVLRAATLPYLALVWVPIVLLLSVACMLGI